MAILSTLHLLDDENKTKAPLKFLHEIKKYEDR